MALWRYRVEWAGLPGGPGLSTFWFDDGSTSATLQDMVDAVGVALTGAQVLCTNDYSWTGQPVIEEIDPVTGKTLSSTSVVFPNGAGTDNVDALPPQTQALVRLHTGQYNNGRLLQGHLYYPGPTETNSNSSGFPVAGYINGLAAQFEQILTADVGWCVYSRRYAGVALIDTVAVWNVWASQRGRRN